MTAADGKTIDHGYHGFGQTAYLHLHVENRQSRHSFFVYISATSLHIHVASCTESLCLEPLLVGLSLLARRLLTGEQHHSDILTLAYYGEGARQFCRGLRCKGIAVARTADAYLCYAFRHLETYLFEITYLYPIHII